MKPKDKIRALHIYVNELDATMAKPLFNESVSQLTSRQPCVCIGIWMRLEIDTVLNQKGWKDVDKLQVCQNSWIKTKWVYIKT